MTPANDNRQERTQGLAGLNRHRLFVLAASVIVVLAILAGIVVSDPPWVLREQRLDQGLVQHLNAIQNAINIYHRDNAKLPATLADLFASPQTSPFGLSSDALAPFEYDPGKDDRGYQLCATFRRASGSDNAYLAQTWKHEAGRSCFKLQVPNKASG